MASHPDRPLENEKPKNRTPISSLEFVHVA
jgi:hypothetical protein